MTHRNDGRWQEEIKIGNGKKFFYGKTKAEVKAKMAAYTGAVERGPTVSEAADAWLKSRTDVAYNTLEGYKAPLKRIRNAFGDQYLKEITPGQVKAFIDQLHKDGYKRTTVQRPLNVLNMICNYAITELHVGMSSNPCAAVQVPRGLKQACRQLPEDEAVAKVQANVGLDFGLFPFFILYSGLRDGEVLALTDKDIDRKAKRIYVTKSLSWQHNRPVIKEPKTDSGVRSVILLDPLRAHLPRRWKGYLFSPDGGKTPFSQTEFRHRWAFYCVQAGLVDVRTETHVTKGHTYTRQIRDRVLVPYQLRHAFATMCFDAGLAEKDFQDLMGHASPETAKRIYTHIRDSRRKSTEGKLAKFVDGMSNTCQKP